MTTMNHWSIFHNFKENDIESNAYYYEHLETLKNQIQTFDKQHQLHILKLIHNHTQDNLTENKNGVFINLSSLPLSVIQKIGDYATYVIKQEIELQERENKVDEYAVSLDQT